MIDNNADTLIQLILCTDSEWESTCSDSLVLFSSLLMFGVCLVQQLNDGLMATQGYANQKL